jgi:hypothetical protein
MKTAVAILACALNIVLGVVSFIPCMMGAAMGMDSPQAQSDQVAIFICWCFLSFPVVCVVCGLLSLLGLWKGWLSLIGLFPLLMAGSVIGFMVLNG